MITNGSIKPSDLEGKVVFWDIDGTLAPYRIFGHMADPTGIKTGEVGSEVGDGFFLHREPSKFMLKVVNECKAIEQVIMGHYLSDTEVSHKHQWLDKHFTRISSRLFAPVTVSKADVILDYCESNGIDTSKVVFVDDMISILKEAEEKGIQSWHISSFLDYFID